MSRVVEFLVQTATTVPVGPAAPTSSVSGAVDGGDTGTGLLGPNFLEFLVLALGAALVVGNVGALLRPRTADGTGANELRRAPVGRSLFMAAIGLLAAVWALASLLQ
jgi:hypothetical protein